MKTTYFDTLNMNIAAISGALHALIPKPVFAEYQAAQWDQIGGSAGFLQLAIQAAKTLTAYESEHPGLWESGADWIITTDNIALRLLRSGWTPGVGNMMGLVMVAVRDSRS